MKTDGFVPAEELFRKSKEAETRLKEHHLEQCHRIAEESVRKVLEYLPGNLLKAAQEGKTDYETTVEAGSEDASLLAVQLIEAHLKEKGYRCSHSREKIHQYDEDHAWTEVYFRLLIYWKMEG